MLCLKAFDLIDGVSGMAGEVLLCTDCAEPKEVVREAGMVDASSAQSCLVLLMCCFFPQSSSGARVCARSSSLW